MVDAMKTANLQPAQFGLMYCVFLFAEWRT